MSLKTNKLLPSLVNREEKYDFNFTKYFVKS